MTLLFDSERQPTADRFGFTKHPDLGRFTLTTTRQEKVTSWNTAALTAAGFEIRVLSINDDSPGLLDAYRYCGDMYALARWAPTAPAGYGWQLVAVYDTEQDPVAVFVRKVGVADNAKRPQGRTTAAEQGGVDPALERVCNVHYRTAERIHAHAPWKTQVCNIAAVVGAQDVPYPTLVHRANEILVKGPIYRIHREGQVVTFGASLVHDGGYVVLTAAPAASPALQP